MYTLADKSQFQAYAIKRGKHMPQIADQEIIDWISKQFGVCALDFSFEKREASKGCSQQLIHVILETVENVKQIRANHSANTLISERFLTYFKSADPENTIPDPLKRDFFPGGTNPFPEIIVTYRPLKELTTDILKEMLEDEQSAILKTIESVWVLSQNVIFYYTDIQMKENLANGTSTKISEELDRIDKKYGLNRSSSYRFDSKESFDRDYEGNWYYYWK
jgi:hypothetical protein